MPEVEAALDTDLIETMVQDDEDTETRIKVVAIEKPSASAESAVEGNEQVGAGMFPLRDQW